MSREKLRSNELHDLYFSHKHKSDHHIEVNETKGACGSYMTVKRNMYRTFWVSHPAVPIYNCL
jgi:hypothetical protein